MPRRIGIYSGTFDPVHTGHIAFALQSVEAAGLAKIYFLPERRPRNKQHVEHFAHRLAMLKQAVKPHPKLDVIELVDISFSVERTLPKLRALFPGDRLVFLLGSDVVKTLNTWPKIDRLLRSADLVVGLRNPDERQAIKEVVSKWPIRPKAITIFDSYAPDISSGKVREALRRRRADAGTLKSVERYSNRHWLYVSLAD